MPYAQVHHSSSTRNGREPLPGDFIVERIAPDLRWFYVLHVLATALFDPLPKNVISHGIVLGSDGQKMVQAPAQPCPITEVLDRDGLTRCAGS